MARDTKQRLADSLKSLLTVKTLDHITVKEIVAQCGINRQTFYYNFQDVYGLLDWFSSRKFRTSVIQTAPGRTASAVPFNICAKTRR